MVPPSAASLEHKSPDRPERVEIDVPVQLRSRAGSGRGRVRNVATGGLFVSTPCQLAVGDWAVVSCNIPGASEPVDILCEVRWFRPFQDLVEVPGGLGLRFVETPVRAAVLALELQRSGAVTNLR